MMTRQNYHKLGSECTANVELTLNPDGWLGGGIEEDRQGQQHKNDRKGDHKTPIIHPNT